jgi:hypothetical protein
MSIVERPQVAMLRLILHLSAFIHLFRNLFRHHVKTSPDLFGHLLE